jgi:hypothetical protein
MRCVCCGRDIDAIGQDNCSCVIGEPLCEDCAGVNQQRQHEVNPETAFWRHQEELYYEEIERNSNINQKFYSVISKI